MTPFLFLAMAGCGGLGACARFFLDATIKARTGGALPWGTISINLSGSFLLGLLTGLVAGNLLSPAWQVAIGTGLLGGFTTFSTSSFETVRLVQAGRTLAGAVNAFGTLLGAVVSALLGLLLASWL